MLLKAWCKGDLIVLVLSERIGGVGRTGALFEGATSLRTSFFQSPLYPYLEIYKLDIILNLYSQSKASITYCAVVMTTFQASE